MASAALKLKPRVDTVADLLHRLGDIPPERILMRPPPGTATEKDVIESLEAPRKRICELVEGVLVEKPMGAGEALYAPVILRLWRRLPRSMTLASYCRRTGRCASCLVWFASRMFPLFPGRISPTRRCLKSRFPTCTGARGGGN